MVAGHHSTGVAQDCSVNQIKHTHVFIHLFYVPCFIYREINRGAARIFFFGEARGIMVGQKGGRGAA